MGEGEEENGQWQVREAGLRQRWESTHLTKTAAVWSWAAVAAFTVIVGFQWGGWVTASTAQAMGQKMAEEAVVKRLAPMCVFRAAQAPAKAQKLTELEMMDSRRRSEYVEKQGWATMPGEAQADSSIAAECVRLLRAGNP